MQIRKGHIFVEVLRIYLGHRKRGTDVGKGIENIEGRNLAQSLTV